MGFQSSINQMLSTAAVAGRLYQDTPAFKLKQADKAISSEKANIAKIAGTDDITQHPEMFKGKEGYEKSKALDIANERYVAAYKSKVDIDPSAENIQALAHRESMGELRHQQRQKMLDPKYREKVGMDHMRQKGLAKVKSKQGFTLFKEQLMKKGISQKCINEHKDYLKEQYKKSGLTKKDFEEQ